MRKRQREVTNKEKLNKKVRERCGVREKEMRGTERRRERNL